MRLFDFFKKKADKINPPQPVDHNAHLLAVLQGRLIELGYQVDRQPQYQALLISGELEIATAIIDNPNNHPHILHLMVAAIHPTYFSKGIVENIVGFGVTMEEKIESVLDNYIHTTFLPIMDSFTDTHDPDLDFSTIHNGQTVLWHPKLGNLTTQGDWQDYPENTLFIHLLKEKVKTKLGSQKLNWLKIYVAIQPDGTIDGECLFNNEPWEEGLNDITQCAKHLMTAGRFQGLKQFVMFRRCDACD